MALPSSLLGVVGKQLVQLGARPTATRPSSAAAAGASRFFAPPFVAGAAFAAARPPGSLGLARPGWSCAGPGWSGASAWRAYSSSPPPPTPSSSSSSGATSALDARRSQPPARPSAAPLPRHISQTPPTPAEAAAAAASSLPAPPARPLSTLARVRQFFKLQQFDEPLGKTGEAATTVENEPKISYRRLYELALTEKTTIGLGLMCLVVASICGNVLPYCIGELMNYFAEATPPETTFMGLSLLNTCLTLGAVIVVGALAALGRSTLMGMSGERIIARLRKQAYGSVMHQEIQYTDTKAGNIVSRLSNDADILGESLSNNLSQGIQSIMMGSIGLGVMLYISVPVTLVAAAATPLTIILTKKYGEYQKQLGRLSQDAIGEMTKVAEEKLGAARIIAAYNAQDLETKKLGSKVDTIFQIERRQIWAYGLFENLYGRATDHAAEMAIVVFGGYMVQTGAITLGNLTSLLIYQYMLDAALNGVIGFWSALNKGLGAGERVFELIDRKPQIDPLAGKALAPTRAGSLRLECVSFAYPSRPEAPILRNLNLSIARGESVAICGGSGSGKSSVQNLILRFFEPDAGTITFDGEDIRGFTLSSWRSAIGLVSQDSVVFTGTVFENIAYGKPDGQATLAEVEAAAAEAGCDFIQTLEHGFDTHITKNSLSGGQKQRLSIARALVRKPRLLLLDEATSALDAQSEQHVNAAISKILESKEITVILVAHRLSSIAQADRVVLIEQGEVVEDGKYDELSTDRDSRFAKLMSAQLLIDVDADEPAPAEEAAAAAAEAPAPTTTAGKQKQAEEKPHPEGKLVR